MKKDRSREAEARHKAREGRSPEAQLKELDRRLGKGKGASKERQRLLNLIQERKSA